MRTNVESGEWMDAAPVTVHGVQIKPYLVADGAFAYGPWMMKSY